MHQNIKLNDSGNNPAQAQVEENIPFVTVVKGPAGYFAAWMAFSSISGSYAILRVGMTKSRKKSRAVNEAESWARREKVEYRP